MWWHRVAAQPATAPNDEHPSVARLVRRAVQLNAPRRGVQRRRVATGTQRGARPTPTRARGRKCRGWPVLLHAQLTPHADVHERGWERDNERTTRGTVHEALKPGEHHAMRAHRDNEAPRMRRRQPRGGECQRESHRGVQTEYTHTKCILLQACPCSCSFKVSERGLGERAPTARHCAHFVSPARARSQL